MSSQQKVDKTYPSQVLSDRSLRTMAVEIYKRLKEDGCQHKEIVSLSSHLLGLVTEGITKKNSLNN